MSDHAHEQFVQQLIEAQSRLYALVLAMTANPEAADEVLQETNVVLLRKEADFTLGTNFFAWAAQVASYQVQSYRKRAGRDRLQFDDALVSKLEADADQLPGDAGEDRAALRECIDKLKTADRDLIRKRYSGTSVTQLAEQLNRSAASISQTLYRIRANLAKCIQRVLAREDRS